MSAPAAAFTQNELLAVMGSRQLRDDQTVFTGVGAPMMASVLAQRRHAPRLTMVIEGGIVGPRWRTGWLPISTNEMRCAYRAQMLPAITDAFLLAQRGFLDVGFIGGAQIDGFGNLNTSFIGGVERPQGAAAGSGGANDIISLCREVIILTVHEKRRFTETVDFVTSPGGSAAATRGGAAGCSSAACRGSSPRSAVRLRRDVAADPAGGRAPGRQRRARARRDRLRLPRGRVGGGDGAAGSGGAGDPARARS